MVVAEVRVKLKKVLKVNKRQHWKLDSLKDGTTTMKYRHKVNEALAAAQQQEIIYKAVVSNSQLGLQRLMNNVNKVTKESGMKINVKKTKVTCISRQKGTEQRFIMTDN